MYDKSTCAVHFRDETLQICCADYEEMDDRCIGEYNICVGEYNICVDEYSICVDEYNICVDEYDVCW